MTEHSDEGRVVTLGLRLRDRTVRKQLYITDTVQVMVTYFIKVAIPHIGRALEVMAICRARCNLRRSESWTVLTRHSQLLASHCK